MPIHFLFFFFKQVECTPNLNQRKLIEFCKEHDIAVTAYSPLGRPNLEAKTPDFIYDEEVAQIGKKYNKTAVQVVLRYLVIEFRVLFKRKLTYLS